MKKMTPIRPKAPATVPTAIPAVSPAGAEDETGVLLQGGHVGLAGYGLFAVVKTILLVSGDPVPLATALFV